MTRIFYFLLGGIILFFLLSFFLNNFVFNQVPEQIADPILTLEKKNKQIFNIDTDIGSDVEYLLGKLNYKDDNRFIEVFLENSSKHEIYLREETYQAFQQMAQDAKEDGINLNIILGARSFADQKTIWENKWSGVVGNYYLIKDEHNKTEAILKHSSMPGTSRHHWGTDIDLNNLQNSYFEKGEGLEVYNWLIQNAFNYGFCQPYSAFGESRLNGHQEEKWHWTHIPISIDLTRQYFSLIKPSDLNGFLGDNLVLELNIIDNYVLGVNKECL